MRRSTMKLRENLKNNLTSLLGSAFSYDEYQKGFLAFEKLLCIEDKSSSFNQDYAEYLNGLNDNFKTWDAGACCELEGFLEKIERLKGQDTEGVYLIDLYTRLGFYDWLNEEDVKKARALDPINSSNADNRPGCGGFHFMMGEKNFVDASIYKDCGHFFANYITAYQLRNGPKAHDMAVGSFSKKIEYITSLFIVYLDQCLKNYDLINTRADDDILNKAINYVDYSNERLEDLGDFNKHFLQLEWFDENNSVLDCHFTRCVKFIGEAGLGKTTQMRKMYYTALEEVSNGSLEALPVWINLSDMSGTQDISLENKISESLSDYKDYYELLLEKNKIMLFLDGYNEVLTTDTKDAVKRNLARDIDEIHERYPSVFISMTDRMKKSNPRCLMDNVSIYTYNGLSREQIKQYVKKKTDDSTSEIIIDYLNGDNSAWLGNSMIIPEKINSLIRLIKNNTLPTSEKDFYDRYLDFILERERRDKKETRIDDLMYLLYILSQELSGYDDEKTRNEIVKLWQSEGNVGDLRETNRLFDLAVELPILIPGKSDNTFRFAFQQYYERIVSGL